MRLLQHQPARMLRERQQLEEHARSNASFTIQGWGSTETGELCLHFRLKLLELNYDGVLVYPDYFPDVPAYIRPQKWGEKWSGHQYLGAGVLCLQFGPDNWCREMTGLQLVQSANELLWGETLNAVVPSFPPVPSRHEETEGQRLQKCTTRFLATPAFRQWLAGQAQGPAVPVKVVVEWLALESVALVTAVGDPSAPLADVPAAVAKERGHELSGTAVFIPSVEALSDAKDLPDFYERLGPAAHTSEGATDALVFVIAHDAAGQVGAFMVRTGSTGGVTRYHTMSFETEASQRLPSSFSKLSGASVAIVGLGSLGSKVAVSLARAGVRKFVLVDDDVLAAHNLVRNELDWRDVGFSKVEAAARALKLIAPDVEVQTRTIRAAGQTNPASAAALAAELAPCSLVVDATANSSAFVALAALTKRAKVAMVWGEVFAGGGGALMARSRPGQDADALSIRTHIHGTLEGMAPAPTSRTVAYGIESEGEVYVASDADVSSLAASMTQFCLDTLCAEQSDYPQAAYLIGFRKFWVFRSPFDVIPVDCSGAASPAGEEVLTAAEALELADFEQCVRGGSDAAHHSAP